MRHAPAVAIVGGGATGVIAALHLLRETRADVTLFEPAEELGAGLAFGTNEPSLLLNVPAAQMSWNEESPGDFVKWLQDHAIHAFRAKHYPFVPRGLYKKYLQTRVREAQQGGEARLHWVRARVEHVERKREFWEISVVGEKISFAYCLIATGYKNPAPLSLVSGRENAVAIYGMGLTAIDHFRWLRAQGFSGVIHFISRRGFFPMPHLEGVASSLTGLQNLAGLSPLELFRIFRLRHDTGNVPWQYLADEGRAQATEIWQAWGLKHRAQFIRHLKPYWNRIRHRVPASVLEEILQDLSEGRVVIHRGAAKDLKTNAEQCFLALGNEIEALPVDPEEACRENLFVLGPSAKDRLWEITAIPEIRRQAKEVAGFLTRPPRFRISEEPKNFTL